jgi:hypothetical protein
MSPHLFHRLRRCRPLFVLALCAWLMMGSMAWAKGDCCAPTGMPGTSGMSAMHAQGPTQPPHPLHGEGCQCACSHMTVDLSAPPATAAASLAPGQASWQARVQAAPQPARAPPLRPPAV